jgi:carbamoylphosphate synthase large subunit
MEFFVYAPKDLCHHKTVRPKKDDLMGPVILLATSCRWYATARLAIAFASAGCCVDMVCPRGHPARVTRVVNRQYTYHGTRPLPSFEAAIDSSRPDLIVPCDDQATTHLHHLHASSNASETRETIERSLGGPEAYPWFTARTQFLRCARGAGIAVPDTDEVPDSASLRSWLAVSGVPAYLKVDATSGGVGVKYVADIEGADRAYRQLAAPTSTVRMMKRLVVNSDASHILPWLKRRRSVVSVQKVIRGVEANSAIACWRGRLLACLSAQVLQRRNRTGPATVLRFFENQQMRAAAEKVAVSLNLTGLFGLDYIIDDETGVPYLIEFNGRATQTCHLNFGDGRNPAQALAAAVAGTTASPASEINCDTVALFPQEWKRDPASKFLCTAFHDVPWAYPELVRTCIKRQLHEAEWLSYERWLAFWDTAKPSRARL